MDSSSRQNLIQFFKRITEWRRKLDPEHEEATVPWSKSHLSSICSYILTLGNTKTDFKMLKRVHPDSHISLEVVTSFMQELRVFFKVPKLHQSYDGDKASALKKTQLFAVFINFLLHLLYHKTELTDSYEDKIEVLKKELGFLLAFLGDTSLLGVELQEVNDLLAEFEDVANEAGSLMFSFIFTMDRAIMARTMDKDFGALLECINLLKGNITRFSILSPHIRKANITSKTASVDSLFIVDSLLYDLEDLMNREDDPIAGVKGQIKILHQGLLLSKSWLKDIRVQQHSQIQELKGIVMRIRDVAYEAEYLINSFLAGDNPLWYFTIRLPDVTHKIKLIVTELQEFKESFDIGALKVAMDYNSQQSLQAQRNFKLDEIIVGLEDEATHLLEQLEGGTEHLQIITIFGMPGLGKTTLAKKLYNHPRASYYFDRRSWCVVSQTYQRKNLLIGILISLRSELDKIKVLDMDEESLGKHIYRNLKGRRYLIVMDDVWDSNAWGSIRRYFPDDGNGSRILFTSRNKDVASPNSIIYGLPSLSNDECWELLQKKVFRDEPCPPQLQRLGKEIAENCHGLPLAVVVVAGILSTVDKEESAWKNVGASLTSYILSNQNNSTIQILKLSYNYLPDHLKQCFLYFGAFPEDTEIPVKKLKCLWIAERFINEEENLRNGESVAEKYLTELIERSLVMVAERRSDGGPKACVVHDLLHNLCSKIAEEENFLKSMDCNYSIYTKHLRLHTHNKKPDLWASREFFLPFGHHIRSLLGFRLEASLNFLNMKLVKVLDLPRKGLSHGDGSEHLVHLRYLVIMYMPKSIDNLVNLEFLIVTSGIKGSVSISSIIEKLVKLKYLSVPNAYFDKNSNSYRTNNLEFLSNVHIDKVEDEEMLKCSPHLRKLKCTFQRLILVEPGVYPDPDLSFLTQLESLDMSNLRIGSRTVPSNIKKLTLYDSWLPCEKMSIIGGLPMLEILKLRSTNLVGGKWDTKDGEFQQLRFLELDDVNIAQWNVSSSEHFPKLQRLVLQQCFYLQEIPYEIGQIVTLQSIKVEFCPESVAESALQIQQEQRDMGNEELRVIVSDTLCYFFYVDRLNDDISSSSDRSSYGERSNLMNISIKY